MRFCGKSQSLGVQSTRPCFSNVPASYQMFSFFSAAVEGEGSSGAIHFVRIVWQFYLQHGAKCGIYIKQEGKQAEMVRLTEYEATRILLNVLVKIKHKILMLNV